MKKLIALVLFLVLGALCVVPAAAADITVNNGTASGDVSVVVVDNSGNAVTPEEVYSVTVTFGTLEFEYKATTTGKMVWDPETHTYKTEGTDDVFSVTAPDPIANAVTVVNHSNVKVNVVASFAESAKAVTDNGVTVTLSDSDTALESAAVAAYGDVDNAPSVTYSLTPSGTPEDIQAALTATTIGTITVTITKVATN